MKKISDAQMINIARKYINLYCSYLESVGFHSKRVTEINRNGTAILHTNDGLSIKIKQSFHNELKYLAAQSTGVRKENVAKALAILEKA